MKPTYYAVKWTENGKKRKLTVQLKATAIVLFNRIIIDCKHYDAVLVEVKTKMNENESVRIAHKPSLLS